MSTSHLVANGNRSLGRDVNLDHLQNTTAKLIATLHAVNLAVTSVNDFLDVRPMLGMNLLHLLDFVVASKVVNVSLNPESVCFLSDELWILIANQRRVVLIGQSLAKDCLLYTSPSPRDQRGSRMPSSA